MNNPYPLLCMVYYGVLHEPYKGTKQMQVVSETLYWRCRLFIMTAGFGFSPVVQS